MDRIVDILRSTLVPETQKQAEATLDEIHKIINFLPSILQVAMNGNIEDPVRVAAAIYLKNNINHDWVEVEPVAGQPIEYTIHEQDKEVIRAQIIDAIVMAPANLRSHFAGCVNVMVKHDFPGKWTGLLDKISIYLSNPDPNCWQGALLALYQLVKNYEYKTGDDRAPLGQVMKVLLPILYQRMTDLLPNESIDSLQIQKQILKIMYAFVQYHLPQDQLPRPVFLQWMEVMKQIIERPVPQAVQQLDIDDRANHPAWKCKKWALHFLSRVFDRYGSPGSANKEYKDFADWFIKTFSAGIITALFTILEAQADDSKWVAPRVLQQTLNYISTAVKNAHSWKLVKQHMETVIQKVVFPLLCYSEEDQELWETDPAEYIRVKFDVFEDYVSPVTAAQTLLHTLCKKRKGMLEKTLNFVVLQILNNPNVDAKSVDGALHMIGSVADILLKKDSYKDQMETMLATYVFPHLMSQSGYLRARACWVLHYFSDTKFTDDNNLGRALDLVTKCLIQDDQLPVKVQAAICFQSLVSTQEKVQKAAEANITTVALELIKLVKETENEDLTNVMQKLICLYTEQLVPIAVEMTLQLANTFENIMVGDGDDGEEKALTAMGLMNTVDTILTMMDDQREVQAQLEPIVVKMIVRIFELELIDLYEEALNLCCSITTTVISADSWKLFELIYKVFKNDGFDYFTEMMPAIHNYVTVDSNGFLSNPSYCSAIYDMAKTVMNSDTGEDAEAHAAKILEVIILQYKSPQIDNVIHPFVELALGRLTKEVKTNELRTMCLQVVIAAMYYNYDLLIDTLAKLQPPGSNQSLFDHFVKQWIDDVYAFQGLHDRKMCVLGLISLMALPAGKRPPIVSTLGNQFLPSSLLLFDGLKVAYQAKASAENGSDDESDGSVYSEVSDPQDLEDEEDHIPATIEGIEDSTNDFDEYESGEETDTDEEFEQTVLESYTTVIDDEDCLEGDEYVLFKSALEQIQATDPVWYNSLMAPLNANQQKTLKEVFTLAVQRKDAAESRRIEKGGGYKFGAVEVPNAFDFGGKPISRI